MKEFKDPRHQARRAALQALFAWSFLSYDPGQLLEYSLQNLDLDQDQPPNQNRLVDQKLAQKLTLGPIDNLEKIDQLISQSAPERPLEQIAKIDLAILRIAVFELAIDQSNPQKAVIDEAVELAKEYGGETSSKLVNGVLGKVVKLIKR